MSYDQTYYRRKPYIVIISKFGVCVAELELLFEHKGSALSSLDSFIIANSQLFIIRNIIVLHRMTVTPCRCVPRAFYF